jgi:hypothetical protein
MNFPRSVPSKTADFATTWKKNIEGAPRTTVGEHQEAVD